MIVFNRKLLILCSVIFFLVVILAAGGYFFWQNKLIKERSVVTSKKTSQTKLDPPPLPTLDLTTWKTYTFAPLQLTLKVPADFVVHTEEPNPGKDFVAYIQNYPFNFPAPKDNPYQLYLTWQKTPTLTVLQFAKLNDELVVASTASGKIGGYPVIKGLTNTDRNRYVVYILKDNTKITIYTSEPTAENKQLTGKIISTFEFANSQGFVCPVNNRLNCMPGPSLTGDLAKMCQKDYIVWATQNCDGLSVSY